MKSLILLTCSLFFFVLTSNAQTKGIDSAINGSSRSIKNTADQIKSLSAYIPKKSKSTSVIKVPGASYGKLDQLREALKSCPNVSDVVTGDQEIAITYKGSLDDVLHALPKKTSLVTPDNISKPNGVVTITLQ